MGVESGIACSLSIAPLLTMFLLVGVIACWFIVRLGLVAGAGISGVLYGIGSVMLVFWHSCGCLSSVVLFVMLWFGFLGLKSIGGSRWLVGYVYVCSE